MCRSELQWPNPTHIQQKIIPPILAGRDVLASSQTGSGKTAAFLLPIIQKLTYQLQQQQGQQHEAALGGGRGAHRGPYALILAPTRELADQINRNAVEIIQGAAVNKSENNKVNTCLTNNDNQLKYDHDDGWNIKTQAIYGGVSITKQKKRLLGEAGLSGWRVNDTHTNNPNTTTGSATSTPRNIGFGPSSPPDIVIACPGRLLDLLESDPAMVRVFDFMQVLVLDEADRMLEMGFFEQVKQIMYMMPDPYKPRQISTRNRSAGRTEEKTHPGNGADDDDVASSDTSTATAGNEAGGAITLPPRQTLFFSATIPEDIQDLANLMLRRGQTETVLMQRKRRYAAPTIHHYAMPVCEELKHYLLLDLYRRKMIDRAIIFVNTKHRINRLTSFLKMHGVSAACIHSDRGQSNRLATLQKFEEGKLQALVASDLVARGIDVSGLENVVNFDLPASPELYIHRVGRTGRQSREGARQGRAFTLFSPDEEKATRALERRVLRPASDQRRLHWKQPERRRFDKVVLNDFEYDPELHILDILEAEKAAEAEGAMAASREAGALNGPTPSFAYERNTKGDNTVDNDANSTAAIVDNAPAGVSLPTTGHSLDSVNVNCVIDTAAGRSRVDPDRYLDYYEDDSDDDDDDSDRGTEEWGGGLVALELPEAERRMHAYRVEREREDRYKERVLKTVQRRERRRDLRMTPAWFEEDQGRQGRKSEDGNGTRKRTTLNMSNAGKNGQSNDRRKHRGKSRKHDVKNVTSSSNNGKTSDTKHRTRNSRGQTNHQQNQPSNHRSKAKRSASRTNTSHHKGGDGDKIRKSAPRVNERKRRK